MARVHRALRDSKGDELLDTGCFDAWLPTLPGVKQAGGICRSANVFFDIRSWKTHEATGEGTLIVLSLA